MEKRVIFVRFFGYSKGNRRKEVVWVGGKYVNYRWELFFRVRGVWGVRVCRYCFSCSFVS